MSELRAALENALGPMYRVEREVRPVGNCRLFVAVGPLTDPELLVKVLPGELSLAMDARVFERELVLLADRLGHAQLVAPRGAGRAGSIDRKSTRLNSSHQIISYAVFCLKKKKNTHEPLCTST